MNTDAELGLQDRLVLPKSYPCANVSPTSGKQCGKAGSKVCSNCFLVLYCSKECQTSHWKIHKVDCKNKLLKTTWRPSWDGGQRTPAFVNKTGDGASTHVTYGRKKFLWGNIPALDVINLACNEGESYAKNIRLLFAASGDLRNVVKTITSISPSSYIPSITAVLNDRDFDIVARNSIILLTAAYVVPAAAAAAAILHTWYSALIPSSVLQILRDTILPLVRDVCAKIADKAADKLLAKTFTNGQCSVRLVLLKRQWDALPGYLAVAEEITVARAQEVRRQVVAAPERTDYKERNLFTMPPKWRAGVVRFHEDGILMPFGAKREGVFDVPNPTFFQGRDVWPMMDSADPLNGWSLQDVLQKTLSVKNDLYGGLFFYLRELLVEFCTRVQKLQTNFVLLHTDAVDLPKTIANNLNLTSFDRIEVSNISDGGYLGLRVLGIFGPLLQPVDENPYATLVALFLNAVTEVQTQADFVEVMMLSMRHVATLLPPARPIRKDENSSSNADSGRRVQAYDLFRDFDALWARYEQLCGFSKMTKEACLRVKPNQTIVKPWPLRLRKGATKAEFEVLFGSSHTGAERYVEWQRAR